MMSGIKNIAFIQLGSNLGNRLDFITLAKEEIEKAGIKIIQSSSVYETEAWGETQQAPFLNSVIKTECIFSPFDLLKKLLEIEILFGRNRNIENKWMERVLDLDILFYNNAIIKDKKLMIPHPHLQNRKFVLIPLNEIVPNHVHPLLGKKISQLLSECPDTLFVKKYIA
ncbi:MAG: 2-amino-4-hydroxy-6-hydroxymethyldihydropteridine diphosphokinase [Bacteroidetes bacterium]|nr:2-amino-4-hydroxy-6-hydroxymethyldihydropteridine diphosphokinase [Bacteroidota bacterium]MBV6462220.1 Bifunctional folate synthesis protein [Flavobacteriales bacterium]WKZ74806.1 MAG: 2-amino-4-hydroxy-6-hydroxymethyldihydropteridine diphosphokinase [Vicingaceae bacterium]MCL4816026.1 2-amino-4-hydroxy-6-hydroxymethyldihydropteridine diphosphokinase [Flavobacteriales bacterium]NOG95184.1 2-amino-4-hydroxy-6-hydroxymethyldihydropteridine diphosphokinase [Bacteroidota bacterium]